MPSVALVRGSRSLYQGQGIRRIGGQENTVSPAQNEHLEGVLGGEGSPFHPLITWKNRSQGMRSCDNARCPRSARGPFPFVGGVERSPQGQWWQAPDQEEGPTSLQFGVPVW